MSNTSKYGYFAKNVAINLEVTTSTLRRWSIELEKAGYTFERNDKDQRIYYQHDINAFKRLKKLISEGTILIDAINTVVSMDSETIDAQKTPSVYQSETRLTVQHIEEILDKKINKAIQKAYEDGRKQGQEETLKQIERLEQRSNERDEKLMSIFRALQEEKEEVKQLIAISKEEKKKNFWQRFFS
ncbi:DNA-binding protein [Priestia filamentosa]|uniref:DNA-binding protein n=1 Tax=Priestia filamentosa TaxID=1402861 RepID=UPI003981BE7D